MGTFLQVAEKVTSTKEDIRESIKHPDIAWLLKTPACERCIDFLATLNVTGTDVDGQARRYEGGRLLLILATMESEDEHEIIELLRLMGTRNVNGRIRDVAVRRQRAGEARKRQVTDAKHYQRYGHLARAQQRLATELHALVTIGLRLEVALEAHGAIAVAKYL